MSKPDKTIDPRIMESARKEFLRVGFEKASLKTICANANVTTGALYKRFKGKEELFGAVIDDFLKDMDNVVAEKKLISRAPLSDEELIKAWDMDEAYMLWWFDYLFKRKESFVLLLKCSEGTKYSSFMHDWVEIMTEYSYEYYFAAYQRGLTTVQITSKEMHVLLSAFWATIYEPFIHDFTWDEIVEHSHTVCKLFDWYKVFHFQV